MSWAKVPVNCFGIIKRFWWQFLGEQHLREETTKEGSECEWEESEGKKVIFTSADKSHCPFLLLFHPHAVIKAPWNEGDRTRPDLEVVINLDSKSAREHEEFWPLPAFLWLARILFFSHISTLICLKLSVFSKHAHLVTLMVHKQWRQFLITLGLFVQPSSSKVSC